MQEIWKTIPYDDRYEVSNTGLVRFKETGHTWRGSQKGEYYELAYRDNTTGEIKSKGVHVIVYETFIGPVPEGYQIHHINKEEGMAGGNNNVNNLECLSRSEHASLHGRERGRKVLMCDLEGNVLMEYPSIKAAGGNNSGKFAIQQCLRGKGKTAFGYVWKYAEN